MTYNRPPRLTTLHFAQRLRMEGETFIQFVSLLIKNAVYYTAKGEIILALSCFVQNFGDLLASASQDSQDEGVSFGDGDAVFKMRRQ
jgi:hypothetical protein